MNSAGSYNLMRPIFSRMRCRQGLWSHSTGQRLFQLGGLAVGDVGHALAFPDCVAAETFHVLGKDNLVTRLAELRDHLFGQRFRDWGSRARPIV